LLKLWGENLLHNLSYPWGIEIDRGAGGRMKDDDFFSGYRIAVVGLGLMGGSIALGLRGHCKMLMAVDRDPSTREYALDQRIVKKISADPAVILPEADLVVIATPVSTIIEYIQRLPELHQGEPVVIDIGSTKTDICEAMDRLPPRFQTVGGHPMCGKEVGGIAHASVDLFQGAPFAFTPLNQTTGKARDCADRLAEILGAHPVWMGPKTHDRWVAATSHLPYLLACALVLSTPTEAVQLISSGFRSASRLASTHPSVMLPIMQTNRENVLEAITRLRQTLDKIESALDASDFERLLAYLQKGVTRKEELTD
jgi:prephenate dehydrogenase